MTQYECYNYVLSITATAVVMGLMHEQPFWVRTVAAAVTGGFFGVSFVLGRRDERHKQ